MLFFDGARGRMHYRRWPVDNPIAVAVLLPGMGQHSGHYHRLARTLRGIDTEMWALDTAGHGLSEGDPEHPGSLAELVADATMLVESVRTELPHRPLVLMGHSLGAVTALAMLGAAAPDPASAADMAKVEADWPVTPSVPADALTGLVLSGVPKRALGGGVPGALGTPLPRDLPVLAVHGAEDRRAPIDAVKVWTARHETVDLREYADAGHDLLHEPVHARVAGDIADWLRGVVVGLARQR
ncbi:alpha/beta hydrolase [Nocardia bovistercoris]|uniref:Alpha/beta hydrolase n=1 Tax=Nocardia bovistercoris TaxID=2785916 RepID=A0A931I6L3_9NOCA|nr:alpha/beta hydrolase [Nocardia bovistercoris]MBH0775829.1 alpha/beta hydrolase [Nocardia bovistercoris]